MIYILNTSTYTRILECEIFNTCWSFANGYWTKTWASITGFNGKMKRHLEAMEIPISITLITDLPLTFIGYVKWTISIFGSLMSGVEF